jgi:hypothetical protein
LPTFLKDPMVAMSLLVRQECRVGSGTRIQCPRRVGDPALNVPRHGGAKLTGEADRVSPASHT